MALMGVKIEETKDLLAFIVHILLTPHKCYFAGYITGNYTTFNT
jgi:hypothetical protein